MTVIPCVLIDKLHLLFGQTCNFQPILHHFFLTVLLALELWWQYGITSHTIVRLHLLYAHSTFSCFSKDGVWRLFLSLSWVYINHSWEFPSSACRLCWSSFELDELVNENNVQAIPILYHIVAQTFFMTRTLLVSVIFIKFQNIM